MRAVIIAVDDGPFAELWGERPRGQGPLGRTILVAIGKFVPPGRQARPVDRRIWAITLRGQVRKKAERCPGPCAAVGVRRAADLRPGRFKRPGHRRRFGTIPRV